ncbi:MAG: helix-turn-helix domain-containing protein [Clostridiales bacterium]|nr:helix-turn-helix domain-containing protein [Clostridiales bacterium]
MAPTRQNIEAERARLGMTKSEMCKELDITMKTYLSYIRGAAIPSTVLVKLRKLTGKTIDYLLDMETT